MLAGILFLESLAHSIHPTPYTPLTPSLGPILNINHSTKDKIPCSSGWFEVWSRGGGHTESDIPSAFLIDVRHRTMPVNAKISADIANLVDDTTTTANNNIHSRPGSSASSPGPSTAESSSSPDL